MSWRKEKIFHLCVEVTGCIWIATGEKLFVLANIVLSGLNYRVRVKTEACSVLKCFTWSDQFLGTEFNLVFAMQLKITVIWKDLHNVEKGGSRRFRYLNNCLLDLRLFFLNLYNWSDSYENSRLLTMDSSSRSQLHAINHFSTSMLTGSIS